MEGVDCGSRHPICDFVFSARDVSNPEIKRLKESSPSANNWRLGSFDPLKVAMICFD
jgi:hypothetical protein